MARTLLHTMHMACGGSTEIAPGACTISKLRKASYAIPRMVRKLRTSRLRYTILRLHKFLDCVEHIYVVAMQRINER